MSAWLRYFSFFRRDARADAADEVRFHIEMRTRDHVARGMSPDDARVPSTRLRIRGRRPEIIAMLLDVSGTLS